MKKINSILMVLFLVISAYSQSNTQNEHQEWRSSEGRHTSFDIGTYITPDIVRNRLDVNVRLHSDYSRVSSNSEDNDDLFRTSDFSGNIQAHFSRYVNTRTRISSLTGSLSFSQNNDFEKFERTFTDNRPNIIDNESNRHQGNFLSLGWLNRWYFSDSFFLRYGAQSNIAYSLARNTTETYQSEKHTERRNMLSASFTPQIGIGFGRIENVTDARQAVYIADALAKRNVLTRDLTNEELFELSQLISTVKNKRFLDSRLHLIDEITAINAFFVENNLLEDNGAVYFTTLYDMWRYGALFSRRSGYEISFVVRPHYHYSNTKREHIVTQRDISNNRQLSASLNFNYEKPFRLNWQHSVAASVRGDIYSHQWKNRDNDVDIRTDGRAFFASAGYFLGYFPNTRTHIQVGASQAVSRNIIDEQGRFTAFSTSLSATLYYYFSPNLRLAGVCGISFAPSRHNWSGGGTFQRNSFSSQLNIQLTYHIF